MEEDLDAAMARNRSRMEDRVRKSALGWEEMQKELGFSTTLGTPVPDSPRRKPPSKRSKPRNQEHKPFRRAVQRKPRPEINREPTAEEIRRREIERQKRERMEILEKEKLKKETLKRQRALKAKTQEKAEARRRREERNRATLEKRKAKAMAKAKVLTILRFGINKTEFVNRRLKPQERLPREVLPRLDSHHRHELTVQGPLGPQRENRHQI